MTTEQLQVSARHITGIIRGVDSDNRFQIDQTSPRLEHPINYYAKGNDLIDRLKESIGQSVDLLVGADRVKENHQDDGRISSYWWSIRGEGVQAPPRPIDPRPSEPAPRRDPNDKPPPDLPPNPAALGSCHNHAVEFITAGILPVPMGRELIGWIHELRDRFYREINQAPVMPLHYCYEHDQEREPSKTGKWGHILPKQADDEEDAYCVEHREGWRVFDGSQR